MYSAVKKITKVPYIWITGNRSVLRYCIRCSTNISIPSLDGFLLVLQINRDIIKQIIIIFFHQLTIFLLVAIYPDCIDIAHVVSTIESPDGAN